MSSNSNSKLCQTDRQSISHSPSTPSTSSLTSSTESIIDRDERHPKSAMDSMISIDNNTLTSIINSILQPNNIKSNDDHDDDDMVQQYLLPVDLVVSVDKSNKPRVQAALPSSFAFQSPVTFNLPFPYQTPMTMPLPTPSIPQIGPIPQMPLSMLPMSMPSIPTVPTLNPTPNPSSTLNPSAASFTPSTTYTAFGEAMMPFEPISEVYDEEKVVEQQQDENQTDSWNAIDQKQGEIETADFSTSNGSGRTASSFMMKATATPRNVQCRPFNINWRNRQSVRQFGKSHEGNQRMVKLLVEFVKHVTLPNREDYPPNKVLTKTWAMKNIGEHEWGNNVELVYVKGDERLSLYHRYPVINAQPGQTVEISATIKTSQIPGRYCTYFRLQKNGRFFGPRVWVDIIVNTNQLQMEGRTALSHCGKQSVIKDNNHKKWKKVVSCK